MTSVGDYLRLQTAEDFNSVPSTSTSGQLPSHFRSISPKDSTEVTVTIETGCQPPTFSKKCLCISFTCFILVTSLATTICVMTVFEISGQDYNITKANSKPFVNDGDIQFILAHTVSMETDVAELDRSAGKLFPEVAAVERQRCSGQCDAYRTPVFRATCNHGYCVCDSEDYQEATCLPRYGGCLITTKASGAAEAFLTSQPRTTYTCSQGTNSSRDIHVISIHGNHFATSTVVQLSGKAKRRILLVLAGNYPVNWTLDFGMLDVEEVVLMSERSLSRSSVHIESVSQYRPSQVNSTPLISRLRGPCGYGDDRHANSRTVAMLREITSRLGDIRTFTGVDFATRIEMQLPAS